MSRLCYEDVLAVLFCSLCLGYATWMGWLYCFVGSYCVRVCCTTFYRLFLVFRCVRSFIHWNDRLLTSINKLLTSNFYLITNNKVKSNHG